MKWFGGKDFGTPLEDWERIIGQNVNTGSDQFKGKGRGQKKNYPFSSLLLLRGGGVGEDVKNY